MLDDIYIIHKRETGKLKDFDNNEIMFKQIY